MIPNRASASSKSPFTASSLRAFTRNSGQFTPLICGVLGCSILGPTAARADSATQAGPEVIRLAAVPTPSFRQENYVPAPSSPAHLTSGTELAPNGAILVDAPAPPPAGGAAAGTPAAAPPATTGPAAAGNVTPGPAPAVAPAPDAGVGLNGAAAGGDNGDQTDNPNAQAEGREITDVRVVGNRVVPVETILAQVRTQRGSAFSGRQAELDRGRIDQLGFFASTEVQVTPDIENPNKVVVTFIVVENRVLTAFKFVNNTSVDTMDLLRHLNSKIGTVLNRNNVNADVSAIQKTYADHGYAVQILSATQDPDGTLVFVLQEARISQIKISGLRKTKEYIIRKEMRVRPGDPFNSAKIRKDLNRIYDLGFFDDANFKVDDDPNLPGSVIVTYLLKEHRSGQLSFGVGFDSQSKLSVFTTVAENNLWGTGKHALVSLETGSIRDYEFDYGNPLIGKKDASFDFSVYDRLIYREPQLVQVLGGQLSSDNTVTYEQKTVGGRMSYSVPLDYDKINTVTFGYRNERSSLFQEDSLGTLTPVLTASGAPLESSGTVSAGSVGFLHDGRDLRLDPSSGSREQFTVEQAVKVFGDETFTKLDVDLRKYIPVGHAKTSGLAKTVIAGRVVLGRSLDQLPAFEQYFIGGSDTVRGYDSDVQFGDNQLYGNLELRYRIQRKFQIVGFADAGSAYGGEFESQNGFSLLHAFGVGIRVTTPIGPIRLDVGKGTQGIRTDFAIGPTF